MLLELFSVLRKTLALEVVISFELNSSESLTSAKDLLASFSASLRETSDPFRDPKGWSDPFEDPDLEESDPSGDSDLEEFDLSEDSALGDGIMDDCSSESLRPLFFRVSIFILAL